jgi:NAD-dependent DNA ligase
MSQVKKFISDPYLFAENNDVKTLVALAMKADKAYYNTEKTILSDQEYDLLREFITMADPDNAYLLYTGASVIDKVKVNLPHHLGSMDKPTSAELDKFLVKFKSKYPGPYMISSKLDGVSGLLILDKTGNKLYTKGRKDIGTDITNLIDIVVRNDFKGYKYDIRGEIIMSKEKFEKYKDIHSNPRNTVSGIVNAKTARYDESMDSDYVGYEIVKPWLPFDQQMKIMEDMGINVVEHELVDDFDKELLIKKYREHVNNSKYECDGIIVSQNAPSMRGIVGNPSYAFAFKNMDDLETKDVIVTEVKWQISKDGYLKPVVWYDPIQIAGIQNCKSTAFNAKYIWDNNLGPGAIITIVRSGLVIPYIKHIISGSDDGPQMPENDYVWNASEVDIIMTEYSTDQLIKELTRFFEKLSILGIASSSISKFVSVNIDTIPKIIAVSKEKLSQVPNFKTTLVNKTYNSINTRMKTLTLSDLMVSSNIFGHGLGATMINKIIKLHPDIIFKYIEMSDDAFYNMIANIDGFAELRAVQFQTNIKPFLELLDHLSEELQDKVLFDYIYESKDNNESGNTLTGKKFIFTSFRDKDWEKIITDHDGEITGSVSSKSYMVIAEQDAIDKGINLKIKSAIKNGVQIVSRENFLSTINKLI